MKRFFYLCLWCLILCGSSADAQVITFDKTFGFIKDDKGYDGIQCDGGGYAVVGYTNSFSINGDKDVYLLRLDSLGNLKWAKTFGDSLDDEGYSIAETADKGFIIGGYTTTGTGNNKRDMYLIKTDSLGNMMWEKTYGDSMAHDEAYTVKETSDRGYILGGYTNWFLPQASGLPDFHLVRVDSNGNTLWSYDLDVGGDGNDDRIYAVLETADREFIAIGQTVINNLTHVYWIRLNNAGDTIWAKRPEILYPTDYSNSIYETTDGEYITAVSNVNKHIKLVKFDTSGNITWQKEIQVFLWSAPFTWVGTQIITQQCSDGGYIIIGDIISDSYLPEKNYVIKTDSAGNMQWKIYVGKKKPSFMGNFLDDFSITQTRDNGYFIVTEEYTTYLNADWLDLHVLKLDSLGNLNIPTGITSQGTYYDYYVNVYPNPIVERGVVDIILPESSSISLALFNTYGKQVAALFEEDIMTEQLTQIEFNAQSLSSGLYFLVIKTGQFTHIEKISIIK